MQDVQNNPAGVPLPIDRVGVRDIRLPITVRDREKGIQNTVAEVDLGVDLPAEFKGTHMSRFVEALQHWAGELDYPGMRSLLADITERLNARRAYARFRFPYFISRKAPATGIPAPLSYQCELTGEQQADEGGPRFLLTVTVPVMTVCPCSMAISEEGAHSQRADVRISVRFEGFVWLEELIDIAEASASSPVYTLLKREDEKAVTENAFASPTFVEDVVRNVAKDLRAHEQVTWFSVDVISHESIHNHNAFAGIEFQGAP